jgi:ketosteroid isomerase-like protein
MPGTRLANLGGAAVSLQPLGSHFEMTRLTFTLTLPILLFSLASQAPPSRAAAETPEQDSAEDVRAVIESANAQITQLLKDGSFDAASMYFAEDVIQLVAGQPAIRSRAQWIAAQQAASQLGSWDLQLEVLELEVSGDIAVERGRGTQTFTANEESPMPSFQMVGDYIVLWKKLDGSWQVQWDYVVTQPPSEQ